MSTGIFSVIQIIGYVAYAITIAAFWQKRDKRLFLLNAVGAFLWSVQYAMLGTWAGAVTETLVAVRSALSAYLNPKHKHWAAAIFLTGFVAGGLFAYRQPYDLINIVSCMIGTVSMIYWTQFQLRYGMLLASSLWFIFNCFAGSIGGVLAGATLIATQVTTLIRMYRDQTRAEATP